MILDYTNIALMTNSLHNVTSTWLTINDSFITTWNEQNTDRPQTIDKFQATSYPTKYIKLSRNRIDTYTYDRVNKNVYFIMEQGLYGISKILNTTQNQIKLIKRNKFNIV
jgi:hypothetical protein